MIDYIIKHTQDYHNTVLITLCEMFNCRWVVPCWRWLIACWISFLVIIVIIYYSFTPWLLHIHGQNPIIISLLILSHLTIKWFINLVDFISWDGNFSAVECLMSTWDFWYLEMTNIRYLTHLWSNIVVLKWHIYNIYTFKCGTDVNSYSSVFFLKQIINTLGAD